MHRFTDLIDGCTTFTLEVLRDAHGRTKRELETSARTPLVKTLQMIRLQKVIMVTGMFSIFESILQRRLNCVNGFSEASSILDSKGELLLKERFRDIQLAINVLKHGRGQSYDALVAKADTLPFRIRKPDQPFFSEGDVSEVSTLIEVDDTFVHNCAGIIREVSNAIGSSHLRSQADPPSGSAEN